ncbi:MAG: glycosyltransferase family 2 protein [Candidatus Jettenia sp.]|uniref:Putative glycosyl transferase n=2 Tax=Candidatus Jettenia TaxID=360731 RepID=I3IIR6_9BACT|nr:glycosyltransferase family 2 protein [Candidatus Jettenia sp.]WKZ16926.1 MAG: glycosyltransferase family 2 protein [Candidatus Jettenia caeni]GAB61611.1 putative glycosyl transferase [Candidatus Jettenia caeni]GJQ47405.1 MAG: glycosyl transferase [Candidatus Jettenia caeni]
MDVTIVIVSYNVADLLNECIISIKKETSCEYEIIVVDNNSVDNSMELLKANHPDVKRIQNVSNVGFAKANNQAFEKAQGSYIFMLNPDTVVLDRAIDKLVQFMDEHPEAGACGPKVLNYDMSLQPSCHHFPTIAMRFIEHSQLERVFPKSKIFGRHYMTYWNYDEVKEVDWIRGCSLLLRKTTLELVGTLDENYFMYTEETDICYRMNKSGWKVLFFPGAEIVHYWGKSSEVSKKEKGYSPATIKYLFNTKYYFFKKHYGCVHFVFIKGIDFVFYLLVFIKNIFRKDAEVRRLKLSYASYVLSLILFGK